MQRFTKAMAAIMLMTAVFCAVGCNKTDDPNNGGINESNDNEVIVTVTTTTPSEITSTTAKCGAEVIISEGVRLRELGVCWSAQPNPIASGNHLSTIICNEPFVCSLTCLAPNTEYYVRAFALCDQEYYYGEIRSFTTTGSGGNGIYNGHEYVDLGLPSGTLWAICNVGADNPEDYGDYFAWGETRNKGCYSWNNYKYVSYEKLTKYCNNSYYGFHGFTDDLTVLQPDDDAAATNWGDGWCMPTVDQWRELMDNTTNAWITQNGVNGMLFTASNGCNLFLPAAGYSDESNVYYIHSIGYFWSSLLYTDHPDEAWNFFFESSGIYVGIEFYYRYIGYSVRAVCSRHQK